MSKKVFNCDSWVIELRPGAYRGPSHSFEVYSPHFADKYEHGHAVNEVDSLRRRGYTTARKILVRFTAEFLSFPDLSNVQSEDVKENV